MNEDRVFSLEGGLPGLEHLKCFALIETEEGSPWKWFQSVDDGNIAFVVVDPFVVLPDYAPEPGASERDSLGIFGPDEIAYLVIAVVPEDIEEMTVNLRAPLVFSLTGKKVRQVILDNDAYAIKHRVFPARTLGAAGESRSRATIPAAATVSAR